MRRSAAVVLLTSTAALGAPGLAAAQAPTPVPAPAPAPVIPAAPAPAPAAGTLKLAVRGGTSRAVLAGDRVVVRGTLAPYVAGQRVTVRFRLGDKTAKTRRVSVKASGSTGRFAVSFTPRRAGTVVATATHAATAELAAARARAAKLTVLPASVGAGSGASSVRALEARLRGLGYVVGAVGRYDARTARAVLALRKVLGLPRTSTADRTALRALAAGRGGYPVRFPKQGRHVEADLSLQVIALIGSGGRVERIYPTSSGKPSTPTVIGTFRFYRKDPGTNALGMVHSSYFIRGYAIHGYHDVPTYNASHGCLRVPVPDALAIFDWVRLGETIDVYR